MCAAQQEKPTLRRRAKNKIAIQQRDCDFERRRSGMDELSRSARKRRIWSLCRRRSQHRIWLVAGVPAARQMLFAGSSPHPLQQKRRKHEKRQTIQHPNSSTRSGNDTPKSSTSPYEPERLCDRVLSRKTHCDSGRLEGSSAAAKSHRQQSQPTGCAGEHGESPVRQSGFCRANSV